MKAALVFLSVVAFAAAVPLTFGVGKRVTIDEDGTITISSDQGKKIVISKAIGQPGPKNVELTLGSPLGTKRIVIDGETNTKTVDWIADLDDDLVDEDRLKRSSIKDTKDKESSSSKYGKSSSQKNSAPQKVDALGELIKSYQGVTDVKSYNDFLTQVNQAVTAGEVNPSVYDLLRSLNQYKLSEKYGYQQVAPLVSGNSWSSQYQNQVPTGLYPTVDQQWQYPEQQVAPEPFNPWATYWQSIVQQKQLVNPWIALKRPSAPVAPVNY